MFAPSTVPLPTTTPQVWVGPVGGVATVTAYGAPLATLAAKVKGPLAPIASGSAPLLRSTRPDPTKPDTVPPTVQLDVEQVTPTLVTLTLVISPVPLATVQVCTGAAGWVPTVTA